VPFPAHSSERKGTDLCSWGPGRLIASSGKAPVAALRPQEILGALRCVASDQDILWPVLEISRLLRFVLLSSWWPSRTYRFTLDRAVELDSAERLKGQVRPQLPDDAPDLSPYDPGSEKSRCYVGERGRWGSRGRGFHVEVDVATAAVIVNPASEKADLRVGTEYLAYGPYDRRPLRRTDPHRPLLRTAAYTRVQPRAKGRRAITGMLGPKSYAGERVRAYSTRGARQPPTLRPLLGGQRLPPRTRHPRRVGRSHRTVGQEKAGG